MTPKTRRIGALMVCLAAVLSGIIGWLTYTEDDQET